MFSSSTCLNPLNLKFLSPDGLKVWGLGCKLYRIGFQGLGFRASAVRLSLGLKVLDLVQGFELRLRVTIGCKVWGLRFRVQAKVKAQTEQTLPCLETPVLWKPQALCLIPAQGVPLIH